MESFNYPTYQDFTSLDDLPDPVPVTSSHLFWTIPLSFNFTFPEVELPVPCHQDVVYCTPEVPPDLPPRNLTKPVSNLTPQDDSYSSPCPKPKLSPATSRDHLSEQATTAQSLYDQQEYDELLSYLSVTYFPTSDHSHLQTLYYNSLYELYKISSGKRRLQPTQKYRLRKSNPLPSTISSVKFKSNNHFDDNVRSLLLAVFKKERSPSQDTIEMLSENTGLTERQIRNFFKNKRSRS